jgi:type I restriction enzyme S subunit
MNLAAMQAISGSSLYDADASAAGAADQLSRMQAEQPELYAELRETAELFPSAMQDSDLGEIPEGWSAGKLRNIASYPNDRISTNELTHDTYVSTENMLENRKGISRASSLPSVATAPSFRPKQILVSNIRPYFKKIWFASHSGGRSPDVLCFESTNKHGSEFLYNALYQNQFFDYMMRTSKGAKMPRGDKKAIMDFDLAVPSDELIELFSRRVESFYRLADANSLENGFLTSLRDTLLPKLLSGELTLSDTDTEEPLAELLDVAHV